MNFYIFLIIINILFFLYVFWFFTTYKIRGKKQKLREEILNDNKLNYLDTAKNIAKSISESKALYKNLIKRAHPDKFNNHKKEKANELSSRITIAKKNYYDLLRIEIEVIKFEKE